MQELKSGYYLWFLSIFIGFSVIIYDSVKVSKLKKMYWPILGVFILTLGIAFYAKWSTSKSVYDFNRGIKNVNYNQFKEAFNPGKPLNVSSYELKNSVKNILAKYNVENASTVRRMLKLFVNSNGLVTYINDGNLASGIKTGDNELLEILLKPTGSTELSDSVDFVHEDKSLLQLARDLKNEEIEKLLLTAGAKLTKTEQEAHATAKIYAFHEDFTNGSTSFKEYDNKDSQWSYATLTGSYELTVKNENKSYRRSLNFTNLLDGQKPYSLSVKVQRKAEDFNVGVGLVFDSNGEDCHIAVIRDNSILIYKRLNNKWIEIYKTPIMVTSIINTIAVSKAGDYITCVVNGNKIIHNLKINSIGGLNMGIICSDPVKKTTVFFDDFKVTGTKK